MTNLYEFDMIRRDNGEASSHDGKGITLKVYAPDLETAERLVKYQNKKHQWRSFGKLIDVKLYVTAWSHVRGHVKQENEEPTVWYNNMGVGLALRIY